MGSRNQTERILSGGMQLVAPGDLLNAGNSLVLENWRVDRDGFLWSRAGSVKRAGPIGSGRFHTFRNSGNAEYAGIGTEIYTDPVLGTLLASGLDGEPVGMAFYRGAGWFMNRSRQLRISGSTATQWGVSAPTTAPVATGGGQVTTQISEWESGESLTVSVNSSTDGADPFSSYAMQGGVPEANDSVTASFDTDNYRSGSGSLRLDIAEATSISAFLDASLGTLSTAVDGVVGDEDVFRIWVFCSNPRAVEKLTVFVKSATGYLEYNFPTPEKFLNQALSSWTQLRIRRRLNLDDWTQRISDATKDGIQQTISDLEGQFSTAIQTPTFLYTGSGWPQTGLGAAPPSTFPPSKEMLALDWEAITEFGITVKVTEPCQIGVDRAEAVGTVGENSSGAISYFVSFRNQYGEDSNPSPVSNTVIAGNQTISLTGIQTSPDPTVVTRLIWRQGGGLSEPLRVGVIWDNATTVFEDHTTNRIAQRDNLVMPINRDLPPAARGVIGPIYGKLVAFNSDLHPARYWYTPAGQPWYFPGSSDEAAGNWEDVGSDSDPIIAATDHRPITVFYKRHSIWRLNGDPLTSQAAKTNSTRGIVGATAVCSQGNIDYFIGPDGVYRFNMDFEQKISGPIDPIFKGQYTKVDDGRSIPPVDFDSLSRACIEVVGDHLRVSYAEFGFFNPNVILLYHIDTGRWMTERYTNLAAPAFTAMLNEGNPANLQVGATGSDGGYLYGLEPEGRLDDGQPITSIWHSRYMNQGLPDNNKVYTEVEVMFSTVDASGLTVYAVFDDGTAPFNLGTLYSPVQAGKKITMGLTIPSLIDPTAIGRSAKNVAIRIECTHSLQVMIFGVFVRYYPEERIANTFDSGQTNFGIPERVKQVDHLEVYMTGAGQELSTKFYSDLPGNTLVQRHADTLFCPNGKGTFRYRFTSLVEGRNFRTTIQNYILANNFQIHQIRARMRPIGEYIDGTRGEFYESPEFSIQPARVGELKDMMLDYDVSAAGGRIEVYSDLPSNAMTLRRTLMLPLRARAPYVFPFETPTIASASPAQTALPYGQIFKIRIYPPPGGILRLHGRASIRARIIGVYFDGTAGEIWETQPLDLLNGMGLFREWELTATTEGAMALQAGFAVPGGQMQWQSQFAVDTSASANRMPVSGRFRGNIKGTLQQFRLVGAHVTRIESLRVLARKTELPDSPWAWMNVPVEPTPDAWAEIKMPVRETPEAFEWIDLAVDAIE